MSGRPHEDSTRHPPSWLACAVALPAALGALGAVVWLLGAALGLPAGADGRLLTLPEAMAVASHADAARLLRNGADPNARGVVRSSIARNQGRPMTPLEAATGAVRTGPLMMLVEAGARIDADTYPAVFCAATARGNRDMLELIRQVYPEGRSPDCAAVPPLW